MMSKTKILLSLALVVGFATGCPKEVETEVVDESTITDPTYFSKRAMSTLATPDKSGSVNYQAAYDDFARAAQLGSNAKVEYNAGWTAAQLGKMDLAEQHYRKALQIDPGYQNAMFNLADILLAAGKYDDAVDIYKGYLSAKPDDLDVSNNMVDALTQAGRYDEAIAAAQQILLKDPQNVAAYRNLSRTYFAKGELSMSQLCAEKARTLNEGDPGIYNNMGVIYLKQGNLPAAVVEFQTAIKLDPDNVEANLNLGWTALNSGDYAQALTCFKAAVGADPNNPDVLLGLAIAQRGTKDYEAAAKTYEQLMKIKPGDQLIYFNAATLYEMYIKDYKQAEAVLNDFIKANEGKIGPNHEVYARLDRVKQSQAQEEKRKKEREAEEARKAAIAKAQQEAFDTLKGRVAGFNKKIEAASCPAVVETGMLEEFKMIAEQGQGVIDANSIADAPDMITFLDSFEPSLDEMVAMCAGSAPAPAPEAPAPAPAPEAPAPAPAPGQ